MNVGILATTYYTFFITITRILLIYSTKNPYRNLSISIIFYETNGECLYSWSAFRLVFTLQSWRDAAVTAAMHLLRRVGLRSADEIRQMIFSYFSLGVDCIWMDSFRILLEWSLMRIKKSNDITTRTFDSAWLISRHLSLTLSFNCTFLKTAWYGLSKCVVIRTTQSARREQFCIDSRRPAMFLSSEKLLVGSRGVTLSCLWKAVMNYICISWRKYLAKQQSNLLLSLGLSR